MSDCIVVLEPGVFLADGDGDPPRVCDLKNAKVFSSLEEAIGALEKARGNRLFQTAQIIYPTVI